MLLKKILKKHHVFYGWAMVFCLIIVLAFTYGIAHNCFSIYIKPVSERFGFTRESFSLCLSIQYIFYTVISLGSGRLFKRFSVLKIMKITAIILPVTYFCLSFCSTLPMFYVLSAIIGLCVPMLGFPAAAVLVSNWFQEKRGTAVGIAFMGSGVGGLIFNALGGALTETYGYVTTYRTFAIIMAVVAIPVIFFLIKERPSDVGMAPYKKNAQLRDQRVVYGYTLGESLKNPNFYLVVLLILLIGFTTGVFANNIVPCLSDYGFSGKYAADINAFYLGVCSVCKILAGMLYDKFGMKKITFVTQLCIALAILALIYGNVQPGHFVVILSGAFGCTAATIGYPIITEAALGNRDFDMLSGVTMAVGYLGGMLSPVLSNAVYDSAKSYTPMFVVSLGMQGAVLLVILLIRVLRKPEESTETEKN